MTSKRTSFNVSAKDWEAGFQYIESNKKIFNMFDPEQEIIKHFEKCNFK
jgi:hypothetical protein